jgi:hypothetical protein
LLCTIKALNLELFGPWDRQVERLERSAAIERLKRFEHILDVLEGLSPKENLTSIDLLSGTWKELSRTHTVWW